MSPLPNKSPLLLTREPSTHRIMISNLHENVTGEDIKVINHLSGCLILIVWILSIIIIMKRSVTMCCFSAGTF